ncbi:MAG: sulfatase-like hydrolase/transferase [Candidatus Latescibacteria bacterium]|nr:sulfatase-like hydrolase/transferase [Candidatus Latescibacterota bacterium]
MADIERPNFLVIMTDQHSPGFLGCYGNTLVRTPNLDTLAAGGMRFSNAYCASPLCVPSRMSFMTTRTPSKNRVWDNHHILSSGIPTWAHALGAAGYETSLVGRMHFVGGDQRHGFERRPLGEYSAFHPGAGTKGGDQWTEFPGSTSGQCRASVEIAGKGTTSYQWFDEQTHAACDFLKEKSTSADRPFAAVVGYVLPHCPFVAPAELFDYYYERVTIPTVEDVQPATVSRYRQYRGILSLPLPDERVRVALAAYYALCEYSDMLIGKVLEALEDCGLDQNTMVIYASDHGEMAGDHGCWWKSCYYEGSVGVPLIVRQPGVIQGGVESASVCNLMDVGPTMIEAARGKALPNSDGRSLLPILHRTSELIWDDTTYSELIDFNCGDNGPLPSRMIRSGKWKYWEYQDQDQLAPALFDLDEDPGEICDLGLDPDFAGIRAQLSAKLHLDWRPEQAQRQAIDARDSHDTIAAWGSVIRPESEDTLAAPDPPVEVDVELL